MISLMESLEKKVIGSINQNEKVLGLCAGSEILQSTDERQWRPAIVLGVKNLKEGLQIWTAEEGKKGIKFVCWGSAEKPKIKIVKRYGVKPSLIDYEALRKLLKVFSEEIQKIGVNEALKQAKEIK